MKITTFFRFAILILFFKMNAQVATPQQMVAKMGRGINLGNTLDAPTEGQWRTPVNINTYFKDIKAAGFKHVRIPVRWDNYLTPSYTSTSTNIADYSIAASYLTRVESVIDAALLEGLVVVMDAHHEHWFTGSFNLKETQYYVTDPNLLAARKARFKALWTIVANRFKSKSDNLIFEVMNEPYFDMNELQVDEMNDVLLKIIRVNNPTRKVIITGGKENNHLSPQQINPAIFADKNLIATFHYYSPFKFTASSEELYTQEIWGSATEKSVVDAEFDSVKTWSDKYGIPVFLGEYAVDNEKGYNYKTGTYSQFGGPEGTSRDDWHRYITNAAVSRGFAPCFWDAGSNSNKTLYLENSRTWDNKTLEIVLGADFLLKGFKDYLFNTSTEGWLGNNATVKQTNDNLSMVITRATNYIYNLSAGVNADLFHVLEVTLKNGTVNTNLRLSFPDGTGTTARTFVPKVISSKDVDYKTYRFDLTGLKGWSGTVNDLRFHIKFDAATNATVSSLPILFDKISFSDGVVPPVFKHSYTFDTDNDNWIAKNSTVQAVNGLINVALAGVDQSGISLSNTVVDSGLNSWVHITLQNQSTTNDMMKIIVGGNSGKVYVTTNDSGFTTYHMMLGKMDSWIKNIADIDILFYNSNTGLSEATGNVLIDSIVFDAVAPNLLNTGSFDFNVDGDIQGWSAIGVTKEIIKDGILTISSNSNTPKLTHLAAGIPAANKYLVLIARNNSSDTGLKISYLNGSSTVNATTGVVTYGRTYLTNTIIAKDPNFTKYIFNCTGTGWSGTINDFQILIGANNLSVQDGSIEIESIKFEADPYGVKNTFDLAVSDFGWKASTIEATTTKILEGVQLDLNKNNRYPKIQSYNYSINADREKLVKITLDNKSTCNKIQMKLPDGTFSAPQVLASGIQTISFDLTNAASWVGVLKPNTFTINFTQDAVVPTGQIVVNNISVLDKTMASDIIKSKDSSAIEIANGQLTVNTTNLDTVYIFDLNGKNILETKNRIIDITVFPKGIYFVLSKLSDGIFISNKVVF